METVSLLHVALRQQLSDYTGRAIDVCKQWTSWLSDYQAAILLGDFTQMQQRLRQSETLFQSLRALKTERRQLLESAASAGIVAADAKSLARTLLNRRRTDTLQSQVRFAELQLAQLRRLVHASWILTSQCARLAGETLRLLSTGKSDASVYIDSPMADNCGGFLSSNAMK